MGELIEEQGLGFRQVEIKEHKEKSKTRDEGKYPSSWY
jgi:hypothetical protein